MPTSSTWSSPPTSRSTARVAASSSSARSMAASTAATGATAWPSPGRAPTRWTRPAATAAPSSARTGRSWARSASTAATNPPSGRTGGDPFRGPPGAASRPAVTWTHRPERGAVERSTRPDLGSGRSRRPSTRDGRGPVAPPGPDQARRAQAADEARLLGVPIEEAGQTRLDLLPPPRADRELAQVPQERHRGVVLAGLLGRDQRLHLAPGLRLAPGQRGEVALARLGGLAFPPRPLPGGAFGLPASPFLGAPFGGLAELGDRPPAPPPPGGGGAGGAEATQQLGAEVRLAPDQPREQRGPLRLRQARDPALHLPGRGDLLLRGAARRRGREQVAVDAQERDEGLERRAEPAEPRRARGLRLAVVELAGLDAQQPAQVEGAQVAGSEVGAQRHERGQAAVLVLLLVPVAALRLRQELEDDVPALDPRRGRLP